MSDIVKIYTLSSPITGNVFYVGSTTIGLEKRLKAGYGCETALYLRDLGVAPIIEEIETVSIADRYSSESFWVSQFKSLGFCLENKAYNNLSYNNGYSLKDKRDKAKKIKPSTGKRIAKVDYDLYKRSYPDKLRA